MQGYPPQFPVYSTKPAGKLFFEKPELDGPRISAPARSTSCTWPPRWCWGRTASRRLTIVRKSWRSSPDWFAASGASAFSSGGPFSVYERRLVAKDLRVATRSPGVPERPRAQRRVCAKRVSADRDCSALVIHKHERRPFRIALITFRLIFAERGRTTVLTDSACRFTDCSGAPPRRSRAAGVVRPRTGAPLERQLAADIAQSLSTNSSTVRPASRINRRRVPLATSLCSGTVNTRTTPGLNSIT